MSKMSFDEVVEAARSERDYQKRRWGFRQPDGSLVDAEHTLGDFLVYAQDYLSQAMHQTSREADDAPALESLRKVMTLCIACFEQHGVKLRDPNAPVINGRDHKPA